MINIAFSRLNKIYNKFKIYFYFYKFRDLRSIIKRIATEHGRSNRPVQVQVSQSIELEQARQFPVR